MSTVTPLQIRIHPESTSPSASHHLVYMIPGNPGLIGYYNIFLRTLHSLLGSLTSDAEDVYHIHGQSLGGFVDSPPKPDPSRKARAEAQAEAESKAEFKTEKASRTHPYSLTEQVQLCLTTLSAQRIPSGPSQGQAYTSVILIGHSVGAYILLELVARLQKKKKEEEEEEAGSPSANDLNITAGILLFPTVTHIAASPSGRKISALFHCIPDVPRRAAALVRALVRLVPEPALQCLVRWVARMPADAAEVTTRFLRSEMGVWQALHMARDEMHTIIEDTWDQDIWGIEHAEDADADADANTNSNPHPHSQPPKLLFYFGQNDHWVADHTRDALIAARGRRGSVQREASKPVMLIDERGIPHAFCLRHSETVAEKVSVWVHAVRAEARS